MKIGLSISKHISYMSLFFVLLLLTGCPKDIPAASTHTPENTKAVSDKPITESQDKLLTMAIDVARTIPETPFKKDRASAEHLVVETCLKMDLPLRAVKYADEIKNWRRGMCYAETAYYLARNGFDTSKVNQALTFAEQIAAMDHDQQWRNDRIKVMIAQTKSVLKSKSSNIDDSNIIEDEQVKILRSDAQYVNESTFDEYVKRLDEYVALESFEPMVNASYGYAELYNIYYEDTSRRQMLENKITGSWERLPADTKFDLLMTLAGFSVKHSDYEKARQLIEDAKHFIYDFTWPFDKQIQLIAKLAKAYHNTGDEETTLNTTNEALAFFNEHKDNIVDIYRAESLRPIAELYKTMGSNAKALSVYKQVIEEGTANTNPRPRSQDLSASCCSMALNSVQPDDELWARIQQIKEEIIKSW